MHKVYGWLGLTIISGVLLGLYEIFRKKALQMTPLLNVLAVYSFFCLLLVSFEFHNALRVDRGGLLLVFYKSVLIFLSWLMSFIAIRGLPISIVTPFGTLNPLFTILLGIIFLGERLQSIQILGLVIIFASYYLIGKVGSDEIKGLFKSRYLYLMVIAMLFSALGALIDKIALKVVNSGQMQFWFSLFVFVFYSFTLIFWRVKNRNWTLLKFNWYIPLASLFLVLSDRLYFEALKIPASQISIVAPLKKISIFVAAIVGGLVFGEKNMKRKLACISLLMIGIVVIFMGK